MYITLALFLKAKVKYGLAYFTLGLESPRKIALHSSFPGEQFFVDLRLFLLRAYGESYCETDAEQSD
jgi:hypothetical protein